MTDERTNKEISAAIAKRLWPGSTKDGHEWRFGKSWVDWSDFASDHNAALGVVVPEMLKRRINGREEYWFQLWVSSSEGCIASFGRRGTEKAVGVASGEHDELPRAICLAAEAVMDAERKPE